MRISDRGNPFPYNARWSTQAYQLDGGNRKDQFHRHDERLRDARELTGGLLNEALGHSTHPSVDRLPARPRSGLTPHIDDIERQATNEVRRLWCRPVGAPEPLLPDLLGAVRNDSVRYRYICDPDTVSDTDEIIQLQDALPPSVQIRMLSDLPCTIVIADSLGAVVTADRGESGTAMMVHPSLLLDLLISMFETLWDVSRPLQEEALGTHPPTGDDREIIVLLAEGNTEEAIARRLDVSLRTVQRRVQSLMVRLQATNRFQAGINAARRNWL